MYRAIANADQPLLQQPMQWIRKQPAYQALAANPSPEIAVALSAASVPAVDKVWTELAYEAARLEVAAELPSRLDSLYAYADPLEAFSFTEFTGEAKQVFAGTVVDGVPWAVVDIAVFQVVEPEGRDEDGYQSAWDRAFDDAKSYWTPPGEIHTAEILVAGPTLLSPPRLELIPLLRDLGIVE